MMSLLHGKKGVVMGVANDHSIAWGISKNYLMKALSFVLLIKESPCIEE
jgi:enoyl-[acyl-carrier-protein] reductase (NADH)